MPPMAPSSPIPAPMKARLRHPPLRATGLSTSPGATVSAATSPPPPRSITVPTMLLPLHFAFDDIGDGARSIAAIVAQRRLVVDAQHARPAPEAQLTVDRMDHDE